MVVMLQSQLALSLVSRALSATPLARTHISCCQNPYISLSSLKHIYFLSIPLS
ncbi:hypothetical protein GLYMA_06G125150v4 [Glycine max]|nr:hypothetical protein GLYMA_06G125150v4 [Glycine max]KAH1125549.1 hypothetical protein GYH30_014904 [Glycine max]